MARNSFQGAPPSRKGGWVTVGVALAWIMIWQAAYWAVGEDLLLASPLSVFRRVGSLASTAAFWQTVSGSLGRILAGFLAAMVWGVILGAATARFPLAYAFLALPMGIMKATPVASFVILALVWISGRQLSVFVSFLMVLPLVWRNVHDGIQSTDRKLLEMAQVYRLSPARTLRAVVIPAALPHLLAAVRVGAGFAWKAGIAGEVIAIPRSAIGTELYQAKVYLETTDLFAWTAVVIILSVLLEQAVVYGIRWLSKRLEGGGK